MSDSPNLGTTYAEEGQTEAGETTFNDLVNVVDTLLPGSVKDKDLTTPPGSPSEGDRYIVGASATGTWSGEDGNIAAYYNGWLFWTPKEGWEVWVDDEDKHYVHDGSGWVVARSLTRFYLDTESNRDTYIEGGANAISFITGGSNRATAASYGLRIVGTTQALQVAGASFATGESGYLSIVNKVDTDLGGSTCTLAGDNTPSSGAQAGWLVWFRDVSTTILLPYWLG